MSGPENAATPASDTEPLGIDLDAVAAWFGEHVPDAQPPLWYRRATGGHSCLTYVITDANGERYVLRRPPVGDLLATAHDVAREHRVMAALAASDVPVPRMLGICDDPAVTGAPFFVMSYLDGVVLHTAADAHRLLPSPAARQRAADTLVDALVALHAVDLDAVRLADLSRSSGYLDRQLSRWDRQWQASGLSGFDGMGRLHTWLVENRPTHTETRIVHGDFRLGNAVLAPDGSVLAVLDWEVCTLGEPLADLAYLLRWWSTDDVRTISDGTFSSTPGFPGPEELASRYAERSGRSLDQLDYWMAFSAWRSAAMLGGVYRRYVDRKMGAPPENLSLFPTELECRVDQGMAYAGLIPRPR